MERNITPACVELLKVGVKFPVCTYIAKSNNVILTGCKSSRPSCTMVSYLKLLIVKLSFTPTCMFMWR